MDRTARLGGDLQLRAVLLAGSREHDVHGTTKVLANQTYGGTRSPSTLHPAIGDGKPTVVARRSHFSYRFHRRRFDALDSFPRFRKLGQTVGDDRFVDRLLWTLVSSFPSKIVRKEIRQGLYRPFRFGHTFPRVRALGS